MKLFVALVSCAAAQTLTSFEGELTDVATLAKPALDDSLIKSVNADQSLNWQAGRNPRHQRRRCAASPHWPLAPSWPTSWG